MTVWYLKEKSLFVTSLYSIYSKATCQILHNLCSCFSLLPFYFVACLPPVLYCVSDSVEVQFELWRDSSGARSSAFDISDIVPNLYSLPARSHLDTAVCFCATPGRRSWPRSSLSVSLSYSERFFVRLNKSGLPKWPEKTERQCTLFVVSREHGFSFWKKVDGEQFTALEGDVCCRAVN